MKINAKKAKPLYKVALLVLNLLGFPLMLLIVGLTCAFYANSGIYKITVYAPMLIVLLMWGVTALLQTIIFRKDKKRHASFKHTMLSCVAIPICCLGGLYLLLDIVLPPVLTGATSGTILYEDIVTDAKGQHNALLTRAQLFLDKNNLYLYETDKDGKPVLDKYGKPVAILDADGKKQYKHFFSEENQAIFKTIFKSFDQAYQSFNGLAIDYAMSEPDLIGGITSGKIPLTVLASIALKTSDVPNGSDIKLGLIEILSMNIQPIVGAIKALIESGFDFGTTGIDPYTGLEEKQALDDILNAVLLHKEFDGIQWNVLQLLGTNPLSNVDPNKQIVQYKGQANERVIGACLGYQDMAWLNSVDLLGIIVCLMDCRAIFYSFAVAIGLMTLMAYMLKKQYMVATGEDCLIISKSKKRLAKEAAKGYYFSNSATTEQVLKEESEETSDVDLNKIIENEDNTKSKSLFSKSKEPKVKEAKAPKEKKTKEPKEKRKKL